MGSSKVDEKILSYHDVVLRRSDLDILEGPNYINDRIIEFYFAHLSASSSSSSTLLVPPSISFWITNCPDPQSLSETLTPLTLQTKDLIIFTVNNNSDVTLAEGGTHWSLLAYYRETNEFIHHDSSSGMNRWHAEKLYRAAKGFVGVDGVRFVEGFTPQQMNGYDCGLYVMAVARVICDWREGRLEKRGDRWFDALKEEVDSVRVGNLRGEVLRLVMSLMTQK